MRGTKYVIIGIFLFIIAGVIKNIGEEKLPQKEKPAVLYSEQLTELIPNYEWGFHYNPVKQMIAMESYTLGEITKEDFKLEMKYLDAETKFTWCVLIKDSYESKRAKELIKLIID